MKKYILLGLLLFVACAASPISNQSDDVQQATLVARGPETDIYKFTDSINFNNKIETCYFSENRAFSYVPSYIWCTP